MTLALCSLLSVGFMRVDRRPTSAFQPVTSRVRRARARPTETAANAKWAGWRRTAPAWVRLPAWGLCGPFSGGPPSTPLPTLSAPFWTCGEGDRCATSHCDGAQCGRLDLHVWCHPWISGRTLHCFIHTLSSLRSGLGRWPLHQLSLPSVALGGPVGSGPGFIEQTVGGLASGRGQKRESGRPCLVGTQHVTQARCRQVLLCAVRWAN